MWSSSSFLLANKEQEARKRETHKIQTCHTKRSADSDTNTQLVVRVDHSIETLHNKPIEGSFTTLLSTIIQ